MFPCPRYDQRKHVLQLQAICAVSLKTSNITFSPITPYDVVHIQMTMTTVLSFATATLNSASLLSLPESIMIVVVVAVWYGEGGCAYDN